MQEKNQQIPNIDVVSHFTLTILYLPKMANPKASIIIRQIEQMEWRQENLIDLLIRFHVLLHNHTV